jgi:hypothetical protein
MLRSQLDTRATVDPGNGYYLALADGRVYGFGSAPRVHAVPGELLQAPLVGIARRSQGAGVLAVAADGVVWSLEESAAHEVGRYPSTSGAPAVDIASAHGASEGCWIAYASGEVRPVGDASDFGDASLEALTEPLVAIASMPNGNGYWVCTADGAVLSFGDAYFYGSLTSVELAGAIVDIASAGRGDGYWMLAEDGGVFCFGSARFHGSLVDRSTEGTPVGLVGLSGLHGYWVATSNGTVFALGNAAYLGSSGHGRFGARAIGIC